MADRTRTVTFPPVPGTGEATARILESGLGSVEVQRSWLQSALVPHDKKDVEVLECDQRWAVEMGKGLENF